MPATPAKKTRKRAAKNQPMSAEHKKALARGREESRTVRYYLEVLEASRPGPGRKRTEESIRNRLGRIEDVLPDADVLTRLHLVQERKDLEAELGQAEEALDLNAAEKDFVKIAKSYSERKGVSYSAWREVGVSADVLKRAGVPQTRG